MPENKGVNRRYNARRGGQRLGKRFFPTSDDPRANETIASRVDGNYIGTTDEILQWAACKWGIDVNVVRAQAAVESWWHQPLRTGWTTQSKYCAPGHGLGVDEPKKYPGQCPVTWGILQNGWYYEKPSWPGIETSTAFNADTAYAIWRACFEGYEWWLRDQPPNSGYAPGDQWGCIGRWYSGNWHDAAASGYEAKVKHYLAIRVWTLPYFQEPATTAESGNARKRF
jgi:autotransporter family porin